jgi:hypothetical protein
VWCGVVWCGVVWCGVVWCGVVMILFLVSIFKKIEMLFLYLLEYSEPEMNGQQEQQQFFKETAQLLAGGKSRRNKLVPLLRSCVIRE